MNIPQQLLDCYVLSNKNRTSETLDFLEYDGLSIKNRFQQLILKVFQITERLEAEKTNKLLEESDALRAKKLKAVWKIDPEQNLTSLLEQKRLNWLWAPRGISSIFETAGGFEHCVSDEYRMDENLCYGGYISVFGRMLHVVHYESNQNSEFVVGHGDHSCNVTLENWLS